MEKDYPQSIMGRRIGAFLLDHFILSFICIIPLVFYLRKNHLENFFSWFFIFLFAAMIIYALKDIFGRSFGKWVFGLSILNTDDLQNKPKVINRILRNITVYIWPVEAIIMLKSLDGRRLGDKLAHTQIVYTSKRKHPILIGILIFVLFFSIISLSVSQIIRNDDSFQIATDYIKANEKIAVITGDIEGFGAFPSGSVNYYNGHGTSDLQIRVYGTKTSLVVNVELTKQPNSEWVVNKIAY